jgi:putative flippase GtrA
VIQLAWFLAVGGTATAVHFVILALLVQSGALAPVPASCLGALAGAVVSYVLNRRYTFRSDRRHQEALPRFLLLAAAAFILNAVLLAAILAVLPVHYLVAQAITTACVIVLTFGGGRLWVFAERRSM